MRLYLPGSRRRLPSILSRIVLIAASIHALAVRAEAAAVPAADIATYQGADRQKKLVEGARKEAQLMYYNSYTWMAAVAEEFEKNILSSKSPCGAASRRAWSNESQRRTLRGAFSPM